MELRFADDLDGEVRRQLGYTCPQDALFDPRGRTVRCTPRRRTVAGPRVGGRTLYRKIRDDGRGRREWRVLHELAAGGFRVPAPVCLARARRRSVVVCLEVEGRPMDALLHEAALSGDPAPVAYCIEHVAPMVRRLHDLGLCHRDLYWNHFFAASSTAPPALIDVERTFRPRWRRRRWQVKDLASLLASTPRGLSAAAPLRFLLAYLGGAERAVGPWARAVARKARRIRRHQPKYG